jgi:glycosyltransferase involved in cell wall biosynthesis
MIGENLPNTKVKSAKEFGRLNVKTLKTQSIAMFGQVLVYHYKLMRSLNAYKPDVILCEGESNILSYLKAVLYRQIASDTALVHWSLGGLSGGAYQKGYKFLLKKRLLKMFDSYLVYSSFGRDRLVELGCPSNRIFVAVNVSDTDLHLDAARGLLLTKEEARRNLGLAERFTVIYAGSLEKDKRLEALLLSSAGYVSPMYNIVILGAGSHRLQLETLVQENGIKAVHFAGNIPWEEATKYFRASDLFVLPGRGGMVISEAMAHGLPVAVYHADGTEVDLVVDGVTGFRLKKGSAEEISSLIERLSKNTVALKEMGKAAQELIRTRYTRDSMVEALMQAIKNASDVRRSIRERA